MTQDGVQRARHCWETWCRILSVGQAQKNALERLGKAWDEIEVLKDELANTRRRLTIANKKLERAK